MARLLIIDDNDSIRFLMRSFIEQAGHIVCGEAADGVAGVELAKRTQPDLILLDFTMPALSGTETAAMLKQVLPDTPIILFTLHGDEINRRFAAVMGADLVVNKADGIPGIAESVKTLLARKVKTSPSLAENRVSDNEPAKSAYESPSKKSDVH
jgi:DNA-binding NarL/FixJ family response regulator